MGLEVQTPKRRTESDDQMQIQNRLGEWKKAMEAKDAAMVMSFYTDDAILFGLAPPLVETLDRPNLQAWFDTWKSGPKYEMRDARIVTGDDLAYCHSLTRMTGTKTSGEKNDVWFRASVCLRKIRGQWLVSHEHTSVPFKMDGSLKAAVDLQPE
jgi:ketosteroid isomerase-like protein